MDVSSQLLGPESKIVLFYVHTQRVAANSWKLVYIWTHDASDMQLCVYPSHSVTQPLCSAVYLYCAMC